MGIRHNREENLSFPYDSKKIELNATSTVAGKIPDVPDAPTIGTASDVGTNQAYNNGAVTVSVTPAATGGAPTSYTATSTPGSITGTGTSSPITVSGLASATAYTFKVTPTNTTATGPASASSGSVTATTVPQAPTVGTPTVATGQAYTGNANVSVPFTPGASGGKTISSYTVTSSSGNTQSGASSPISVSDVVGTARTYTVTATNANGTSLASSASAATTPSSVPQAPTIGTPTVTNSTTVSIPFTAGGTGGSTITSYTTTSSPSVSLSTSGTSSPLTVTGSFASNTAYTFQIAAVNANGTSSASSASSAVTPNLTGMIALATITSTGGETSLTFSSIPTTYTHLCIRGIGKVSSGTSIAVTFNADNGSNYNSAAVYNKAYTSTVATTNMQLLYGVSNNISNVVGIMLLDIYDYASTTKAKTIKAYDGLVYSGSYNSEWLRSGSWMSNTAINSITLTFTGTLAANTSYALYGIKAAA
jgi:trimeric autotransporter adhesin